MIELRYREKQVNYIFKNNEHITFYEKSFKASGKHSPKSQFCDKNTIYFNIYIRY